jgi:hypothetical protein
MNLVKIGLLLLLAVSTTAGIYSQKHSIQCEFIVNSDFINAGDQVYFDPSFLEQDIINVKDSLRRGKIRVERTFGIMSSEPTIIVTNNEETARDYGANATGVTLTSPLGQCIVIGPNGQNTDVFAHELVHAELADRLGYYTKLTDLPTWFDEGLALSVDNREPYRRSNINLPNEDVEQVQQLFYADEFFANDSHTKNYQASKIAVSRILARMQPKGIYRRLEKMRYGNDFSVMFSVN